MRARDLLLLFALSGCGGATSHPLSIPPDPGAATEVERAVAWVDADGPSELEPAETLRVNASRAMQTRAAPDSGVVGGERERGELVVEHLRGGPSGGPQGEQLEVGAGAPAAADGAVEVVDLAVEIVELVEEAMNLDRRVSGRGEGGDQAGHGRGFRKVGAIAPGLAEAWPIG